MVLKNKMSDVDFRYVTGLPNVSGGKPDMTSIPR